MIAGHQKQWDFLKNKFDANQLSHAYLFAGQEQLGKKFLAKELTKLINCKNRKPDLRMPCQKCFSCQAIEKESFPDAMFLRAGERDQLFGDGDEIKISKIREAQNFLSYKSYYGGFKSVVIDNAEKMNQEAQSCFLKTLEEPKGQTLLILVTSKPEMLLPTIFSRCQTIKFFPASQKEIKEFIKDKGMSGEAAQALLMLSEGKPGRAAEFISDPKKLEKEKDDLKKLLSIADSNLAEKFQYVKNFDFEKNKLSDIFQSLERYFRYLLFLKAGAEIQNSQSYFPKPSKNLENYPVSKIKKIIRLIESISQQTSSTNSSPKLALEILLMEI